MPGTQMMSAVHTIADDVRAVGLLQLRADFCNNICQEGPEPRSPSPTHRRGSWRGARRSFAG
jgi:hypothetical protein